MRRKKRRLKIKNIIKLLLIIIVIIILCTKCGKSDLKITMNKNTLEIGEEYQNDFIATYKGKDVTSDVTVTHNISSTKLGKYPITFKYVNNNKEYKVIKKISIIDTTKPNLTLKGGNETICLLNEECEELGYTAIDNYDGDITNQVKATGKVTTTKEGQYNITYTVTDKNKNKTEVIRKVTVTNNSPLKMNKEDFTLDGYFKNVILEETPEHGNEYINEIIFAGDSMPLYYVINGQISGTQLWHRESINPETALTNTIYIAHQESGLTFIEAYEKHQPKISIMTLGTNSAAFMEVKYFIECYKKLIEGIMEVSPNTKLIIQAIPPVDGSYDKSSNGINNEKINKFNYYIAQLCSELGIPFLNSATSLKDKNGACKEGYCRTENGENGIHPTKQGNEVLMKYIKTHAIEY